MQKMEKPVVKALLKIWNLILPMPGAIPTLLFFLPDFQYGMGYGIQNGYGIQLTSIIVL